MVRLRITVGKKLVHDFNWNDVAEVTTNQHADSQLSHNLNKLVYAVGVQLMNQRTFDFFVESPGDYTSIAEQLRE